MGVEKSTKSDASPVTSMVDIGAVGKRILSLRGFESRASFAKKFGVAMNTITRYENGGNLPESSFLVKLCLEYKVASDWILFGDEREVTSQNNSIPLSVHENKPVAPEKENGSNESLPQPVSAPSVQAEARIDCDYNEKELGLALELDPDEFEELWDQFRTERGWRRGWLQVKIAKRFPEFVEWLKVQPRSTSTISSDIK